MNTGVVGTMDSPIEDAENVEDKAASVPAVRSGSVVDIRRDARRIRVLVNVT
jgi:hypothetical protein